MTHCPVCNDYLGDYMYCQKKDHTYASHLTYDYFHFGSFTVNVFNDFVKIEANYRGKPYDHMISAGYKVSNFRFYPQFKDYNRLVNYLNKLQILS